jgi:hypothetical protein
LDQSCFVLSMICLKSNGAHANSCKRCGRHASSDYELDADNGGLGDNFIFG